MPSSRIRLVPLTVLALLLAGPNATRAAGSDSKEWTVDDLVLAESAGQWSLSPDGRQAVWVRSTVEKVEGEEKRVSNLWASRLDAEADGGEPSRPLTRGTDSHSSPLFSPDGRHVAFLSTRDLPAGKGGEKKGDDEAKPQVWLLPLAGGEAWPVTRFDRAVRSFDWIDAETLVVLAEESPTVWEATRKKEKDTTVAVDDAAHEPPVRLFRVPLEGEAKRLSSNDDWIDRMDVSPDGRWAVVNAQQSLSFEFDSKVPPHTYLVDLGTGERERLFEDGVLRPEGIAWKLDSSGFFAVNLFTRHPVYRNAGRLELHEYDLERGTAEEVDLDWERGLGRGLAPTPAGFLALLADGVRYRAARYVETGGSWRRQDLEGTHAENLYELVPARDGSRVVYVTSKIVEPDQWYAAGLDGARLADERRLTKLNRRFADKPKGDYEIVRWQGARGDTVEGILHYPLDWKEGERRPLVLDIHGGPWSADLDRWGERWVTPNVLWRQRGAFVLQVNYHGSSGYGREWAESIEKNYYEFEVPDIESGVDHLIERGLVDPERLAATGWSNGGILTAALLIHTRRYKAAVVGAADVEWASDWANVDFGASFDNYYFGTTPWEDPQLYVDKSPFYYLEVVTTPTIVHTGTEDRNVPPHQSWSLFRALQYIDKAPVKLLTYPGEPHGLRKIAHQRRKAEEDLAWLDKYLFETWDAPNEAVKEGSLLEALLRRSDAARVGRAFGREENGVLVPETVTFKALEIGRFELTRAQYAAFDEDFLVTPGDENLPVTDLSFERAAAYVDWLTAVTGRTYRLPTEKEAKGLAEAAGDGGNTLDRWAGYTPNPEDAARLAAALEKLGGAPLLLPVGQGTGKGEDPVFDLDGNAAEWAVGEDGGGVAVGPSADRSTDERGSAPASAAYTGWRVVEGRK